VFTFVTNRLQGSGVGAVVAIQTEWMRRNGHRAEVFACPPPSTISGRPNPVLARLHDAGVPVRVLEASGRGVLLRRSIAVARLAKPGEHVLIGSGTIGSLHALFAKGLRGGRLRTVVEVHGDPPSYEPEFSKAIIALTRRLFRHADAVTAVSPSLAEAAARYYTLPAGKVAWRHNPLEVSRIRALAAAPPDPWSIDGPYFVGCGRLNDLQKRWTDIIDAFHASGLSSSFRLLILGEGRDRARLEDRVRRLDLQERVLLPGYAANPYAYMARAAAFILASATEGSPTVVREALVCGVPIISSDCRFGPREILQDERCGLLFPVGDVPALTACMLRTVRDPEAAAERVRLGRERAAAYDVERIMPLLVRLYSGERVEFTP
jgi:glycosyltransferase involved in cell wall biosynthesis